ncbi:MULTISPECIES: DUF996 domain-containing protein [Thermotoga]|nr:MULTISPECIES: DUF996 domain-containing protein [Thermotoga]ABQ47132.1 hypothetical protein Tpet_1118 [Thermotoga petrophila RKU-1]
MNLSTAKTLAGVGMIFKLFGAVPVVGWIFSLVGLILFLIGIYNISQQVGERRIFNYLLIPAVLLLIVSVIFSVSLVASLFAGGLFAGGVT